LENREIAHQFLYRFGDSCLVGRLEGRELLGMVQQRERTQPEHVRRRLVPADEQYPHHARYFLVLEVGALREAADDVVGGFGSLRDDQVAEEGDEILVRGHSLLFGQIALLHHLHVVLEPVTLLVRNTEQFANHH
jgi:hypothetical protein